MRRGQHRARRPSAADIVVEDAERLLALAMDAAARGDLEYSSRLGGLVLRMAQANRVRLPRHIRLSICKNCHVALVPGVTLSVRTRRQGRRVYLVRRCLACGYIHRLPLGSAEAKASGGTPIYYYYSAVDPTGLGAGKEGDH